MLTNCSSHPHSSFLTPLLCLPIPARSAQRPSQRDAVRGARRRRPPRPAAEGRQVHGGLHTHQEKDADRSVEYVHGDVAVLNGDMMHKS